MPTLADRITARSQTDKTVARADPVSLEEFSRILSNPAGKSSTYGTTGMSWPRAMGITAWYSGARYISETVSMLPWRHFMKLANDERAVRADWPWLASPDIEQTWQGWGEHQIMSLIHDGNGFSFKLRNPIGQVVGLRELFPDRVTGGTAPDGTKRFLVDHDPTEYTTREILHIPGLAYNGRFGINPIRQLANALGAVAAADDFASRWFTQSTNLGGIISIGGPLSKEQTIAMREEWDAFHQGLLNAHKTGVLSQGSTYSRISLNAADSQLLESRTFGIDEISRALRIPPHKLYELTRSTNNNIEHQSIESVTDSIRPWAQRIENAINNDRDLVGARHYLEADLEGVLRGDSAARATFYNAGVTGGWMMPSTPARKENLPSPPELDYFLRPLNMAVIRPGQPDETPAMDPNAGGGQ